MHLKAAALYVEEGELGPALRKLTFDGISWAAHEVSFETSKEALEAWEALGVDGYLRAEEGFFYINGTPDAASVTIDGDAGHICLVLDAQHANSSMIGFVSNSRWVLENGIGFLRTVTERPRFHQETLERTVN
jgi:hypothetical protein